MNAAVISPKPGQDYVVADLALADWGRKEMVIAASEMPGLMAIRKEFALSIGENSVHGSDGAETAAVEIAYFFSGLEIVG